MCLLTGLRWPNFCEHIYVAKMDKWHKVIHESGYLYLTTIIHNYVCGHCEAERTLRSLYSFRIAYCDIIFFSSL